ncbi:rhodanese-like domain-containing protein [Intrasporangium calvum]|uniref:Rhodanese-like domain-containing protein n=1 Tax=Intrasporangium calvum TaxID=53358 RepID=A0ABT5GKF5_9MICO|nr:rhodanese-like domain-containing protein [Intrasporangium calvum]MDC5698380.1 rhodanese-like domain-containing protein [Intrasporangium calvum]
MSDSISTSTSRRPAGLDAPALQEWLAAPDGPRLLDVRTPAEFEASHIPGSYNVPLDLLKEHREEFRAHLDEDLVLICRSGARATQAEGLLAATDLPNVHVLVGGVTAWESAGAPLNRGAETWELERQVRLLAGAIVLVGVLLSIVVPWAKWISAGIGAGLVVAALTNSCLMGLMLAKMPWNRRETPDLETVLRDLAAADESR